VRGEGQVEPCALEKFWWVPAELSASPCRRMHATQHVNTNITIFGMTFMMHNLQARDCSLFIT
jgi:hypothetical protein